MAEGEVLLRFRSEGHDEAKRAVDALLASARATADVQREQAEGLSALAAKYRQAQAAGEGLGGVLNVLNMAWTAATSPVGLLAIGLGAVVGATVKLTGALKETYVELRRLEALTGLNAKQAEALQYTFQLAGLSSESLGTAMFRMSNALESGGKQFEHLGISIRKPSGDLKEAGELFLEVRERISRMTDATEANHAAMQLFGRQGRELIPMLRMSADEFARLHEKAEKNAVVTDQMMGSARRLIEVEADLEQKVKRTRLQLSEYLALPFTATLEKWMGAATRFAASIQKFGLGAIFVGKEQMQQLLDAEAQADKLEGENARRLKERAEGAMKGAQADQRLTEGEIKNRREAMKTGETLGILELRAEAERIGEAGKLREGSDMAGIRARQEMSRAMIDLAEQRYQDEMALARQAVHEGGRVDTETTIKLERERALAVARARDQIAKDEIAAQRAMVGEAVRRQDEQIKVMRAGADERVMLVEDEKRRELAALQAANEDAVTTATRRAAIEEGAAKKALAARRGALEQEREMLLERAAAFKDNAQVQEQVQLRLAEIDRQRVRAETDADNKIADARRAMVDRLKQEADREAGLGDALTSKALENLKKRGATMATELQIAQEIERVRQQGAATFATLAGGGRVGVEQIQEAMATRGSFAEMAELGTTAGGALAQSLGRGQAAFMGQRFRGTPTAAGPPEQRAGESYEAFAARGELFSAQQERGRLEARFPGGAAPGAAAAAQPKSLDQIMAEVKDKGDKAIQGMLDKVPAIMEGFFQKFSDALIRKLETESART